MLFFLHIRVIYFNLWCQKNSSLIVYLLFFLLSSSDQVRIILRLLKLCPGTWIELNYNNVEIEITLSKSKFWSNFAAKVFSVWPLWKQKWIHFIELLLSALGGFALVLTWKNFVVHYTGSVFYLWYTKD